ncbi:MAG: family 16 glycosylhydrolase [Clostridiaceae bacterium]|nr:family 16 glycosylhydrolase [Clostridiaceae bacterium]
MLKKRMLSVLIVNALVISTIINFTPVKAATGDWQLAWSDEFNGAVGTGVDTSKWVYETGGGGWGNGELENYTNRTENVYMEQDPANSNNRFLTIKAIKENYGGSEYTSGRIKTNGKFDFTYGKVEMRAKLPIGQGIWPAFWMLGSDIGTTGWPNCGETDIMEFVGSTPTKIYGTIHGPGYNGAGGIGGWHDNPAGFSNDFHTYAIEWEPNVIRWYFDGQLYEQRTTDDLFGRTWVFNHNDFLLLNLAVGGAWPGSPDASTVFPQKYSVDYVRVYQRQGGLYPTPVARSLIQLKNVGNGQFVSSDSYNGDLLYANRGSASTWETFEQKDLGNGNIALISLMNYKYASASAVNNQLIAIKESVGATETFQKVTNADGTISLKCAANGKYVTAPVTGAMTATATTIGNNEKFNMVSVNGVQPPLQVTSPSFNPAGGTYASAQSVTLSCATAGATIKYTIDGSTPTATSTTYTGAINVGTTTTIKAYAINQGMTDSAVVNALYTITTANNTIPGKLEAEKYSVMSGVQTETCSEGTLNVGWIDTGDWMDYNVNVPSAGSYTVQYRVSSPNATGQIQLKNGNTVLATTNIPNTGGWQNWQTVSSTVNLAAGNQTLRVYANVGGFNLNWCNFLSVNSVNLALNKPVTESGHEGGFTANSAFDGNTGTRWSSAFSDPQWISVDLGAVKNISRIKLNWEAAYGKAYKLQVSNDGVTWVDVYTTTTGDGGIDDISINPANGRYCRMYGSQRATGYGYSLWEFEVY